ncbi:MAG: L-rhamnose mutarotase [Thermomicrobiales bacterium]
MVRKAFLLRLKPGSLDQYVYWHDNIWPELIDEMVKQGIHNITLWNIDDMVFLSSEVENEDTWQKFWDTDVHRRWGEVMNPFMHYRDDGIVDSREIREIWHIEPSARA